MFDKTNPFQTGSRLLRWLWTVCVTLRKPFSRCKAWQGAVKCDWWHLWRRTITAQYILCSHVNVSPLIFMKLVRRIWASLNVEVSNKIRKGKQMQKEIFSDRRDHWTTTLVYGEEQQFIEWIVFVEYLSIYQWRDILFPKEKKAIRLYYQLWLLTNRSIQSHVTSFSINFHSRSW